MWNVKTRKTRERREEEEKPAGVPGMETRKAFGSSRRRLNGERRLDKGLTWRENISVLLYFTRSK